MAKVTGISVSLRKQSRTETAKAADNKTETAQAADNKEPKRRKPQTTKRSLTQALQHARAILRSNANTDAENEETGTRKGDESKQSVNYTKLGAFEQLRLRKSQETEDIRKSTLPFSFLGPS